MRIRRDQRSPADIPPRTPMPMVIRIAFVLPMGVLAIFVGVVATLSMIAPFPWNREAAKQFFDFAKPVLQAMATGQLPPL